MDWATVWDRARVKANVRWNTTTNLVCPRCAASLVKTCFAEATRGSDGEHIARPSASAPLRASRSTKMPSLPLQTRQTLMPATVSRGFTTTRAEQDAHRGFHPQRAPYGRDAMWGDSFSTKKEPPAGMRAFLPPRPERPAWSPDTGEWPPNRPAKGPPLVLMRKRPHPSYGTVLRAHPPVVPLHHFKGYESPDRALVGDEELAAKSQALRSADDDARTLH